MAAAEARTAWQRAANRYFVQEDAKRAPKLACCQSSTSSSKQVDSGQANAAVGPGHSAVGFMPSNRTPPCSSLPPDAKWWLQMQPNYGLQRCLNVEQLNEKTTDVETPKDPQAGEITMMSEESIHSVGYEDLGSFLEVKKHPETKMEELNVLDGKLDQDYLDVKTMTDYYEFLEMEMVGGSVSKRANEFCSNADSSWVVEEKVPWWRVTDGEELASFVAQKSLHHVENCDLPPPQKMNVRREPFKQARSGDHDEILMSSIDWEAQSDAISISSSGDSQRKHLSPVKVGLSQKENASTEPFRLKVSRTNEDTLEKRGILSTDPGKAELLEALCHSQTRAREAEKAAKQAYTEKEHLLKLFFRQASQLFAYKQWFKLLQLESLLLQAEDEDSSPLLAFPGLLPWMPQNPRKLRKSWQKSAAKAKRRKRGSQGNDMGRYAVAFAVGFTLVGAGLILGWTVGWLLPAF